MQINETKEFHKNLQPARNHIDHQETPANDMQERPWLVYLIIVGGLGAR